ncbi:MAG: hypothetical protein AB7S77_24695 [Desulfatirhabdiaceae bacterium]
MGSYTYGGRPDLTGGGLIRSLGGWDEIQKMRRSGQDRIKGDQRILGRHDFVTEVLVESEDPFSRKYRLRAMGYDFWKIVERTCNLFQVEKDYVFGKSRQKERVMARDLICYWAVAELAGNDHGGCGKEVWHNPIGCRLFCSTCRKNSKKREFSTGNISCFIF